MLHEYFQDHEDERYGDEHEGDKAHLHIHPTHKAHYRSKDDRHKYRPIVHHVDKPPVVKHDAFWYGDYQPQKVVEYQKPIEQQDPWVSVDHHGRPHYKMTAVPQYY